MANESTTTGAKSQVSPDTAAAYPNLTPEQIAALDQTPNDGKVTPGGSEAGAGRKAKIGERVRKGAPPPATLVDAKPDTTVIVRITKAGHGEVHDGEGERYDWNDEVPLPYAVAEALEDRKFAEIIG